jgi:hypothetical protein
MGSLSPPRSGWATGNPRSSNCSGCAAGTRPVSARAVEQITERQVIAFFSDNHIDPDMAVEGFVLAPQAGSENPDQPSA